MRSARGVVRVRSTASDRTNCVEAAPAAEAPDRRETATERLDRNWSALLQELRVTQTGVQLLTGFLLTLPFQQRFGSLDNAQRALYLATVASSIAATLFLIAPVGLHRLLFRRHRVALMVALAHRLAICGMVLLGFALTGVVALIFGVVLGAIGAAVAAALAASVFVGLWVLLPLLLRGVRDGASGVVSSAAPLPGSDTRAVRR